MIGIVYPSGSHGMFLELLLNSFSGVEVENNPIFDTVCTYDRVTYKQEKIFTAMHVKKFLPPTCDHVINIRVDSKSYLKYIAVCLNRTSGLNIILEDLNHDTFNKIKQHPILSKFLPSLATISNRESGDVEIKYLREWARMCFFNNNNRSIDQFTEPAKCLDADYILDYECFYDNQKLLEQCKSILDQFDISVRPVENIQKYLTVFKENNRYKNIDSDIVTLTQAIINKENYEFNSENFIKQAWIDNWLESMYNVNVKLQDEYWTNTKEIIEAYNL
jgi:hypothetical protein